MFRRKCRLLYVALLAICAVTPAPVWALGMGEIDVDSALNERFEGSISLLDVQGFQSAEIVVSLASRQDFDRVGVERFFYLTQLKFDVDLNASGGPQITVSSSQPISEPYLNFIVEVLWPNGKLLKEFTVLLDPPTFSEVAATPVQTPAQVSTPAPAPAAAAPARPASRVTLRPTAPAQPAAPARSGATDGGVYTTRDDTLWTIASRTLPSNRVTVNQQMLAIQRLNRQAFIRDNINLLKAGYELEMPSEAEALSMTASEANLAVANQTNDWRTDEPTQVAAATPLQDDGADLASQVDATSNSDAAPAAAVDDGGQVRIVANSGELASGTARGSEQVNQLIEESATLNRQVEELSYQLDREKEIATNQISVKERQLEVKDQEIAELQQQLQQVREQLHNASQNQTQAPKPEPAAWWQNPILLIGVIGVLILLLAVMMIALRRNRAAEDDYAYEPEVEPAYADDADDGQTQVQAQPLYADAESDEPQTEFDEMDDDATLVEPVVGAVGEAEETEDVFDLDDDETQTAAAAEPEGQTQTSDVIGEAEIYIAYGRYGQAANLLLGVLADEPDRYDVRLKLLEVYVESNDDDQFEQHAQYVLENCNDEDILMAVRDLESQLSENRVVLDDAATDTDQTQVNETTSASEEADMTEDLTLDLDDLESAGDDTGNGESASGSDDPIEFAAPALDDTQSGDSGDAATTEQSADNEFELEFDLDVDPSDDAVTTLNEATDDDVTLVAEPAEEEGGNAGELGGDLGIDFDPDQDVEEDVAQGVEEDVENLDAAASAGDDDTDFDLDTLLDDADAPASAAADAPSGPADDDFEFDGEADADINGTKLDLAEAYIDMGDADGARDILNEVVEEGTPEQQSKAQDMLAKI
ncbi:MAG: FimV/HubP family polar landmark protein [Pseudomonadota bacterium]